MTNDPIVPAEIVSAAPERIELQSLSDTDLKSAIRDAIGLTETAIRRVATLWVEALRRGIDLSDVRFALAPILPAVARGDLLPALVVTMAGQTRSLQRLAELPIADQRNLAEGAPVEVYNAARGVESKPLKSLSFPELAAAVRHGRILTADEQRKAAAAAATRPIRRPRHGTKIVELRLAADTYEAAARAAADEGLRLDDYLRRLVIASVSASTAGG